MWFGSPWKMSTANTTLSGYNFQGVTLHAVLTSVFSCRHHGTVTCVSGFHFHLCMLSLVFVHICSLKCIVQSNNIIGGVTIFQKRRKARSSLCHTCKNMWAFCEFWNKFAKARFLSVDFLVSPVFVDWLLAFGRPCWFLVSAFWVLILPFVISCNLAF